jgi:hypothetical protein
MRRFLNTDAFSIQLFQDFNQYDENVDPQLLEDFNKLYANSFKKHLNAWIFMKEHLEHVKAILARYNYQMIKTMTFDGFLSIVECDDALICSISHNLKKWDFMETLV